MVKHESLVDLSSAFILMGGEISFSLGQSKSHNAGVLQPKRLTYDKGFLSGYERNGKVSPPKALACGNISRAISIRKRYECAAIF